MLRSVDRNSETYTAVVPAPGLTPDLCVDTDHAPASVEERAAGVPVGNRSVRLDRVHDREAGDREGGDRAVDSGDDADSQRVLVAEWAPDRGDGLSNLHGARLAERYGRQPVDARIDPDQ